MNRIDGTPDGCGCFTTVAAAALVGGLALAAAILFLLGGCGGGGAPFSIAHGAPGAASDVPARAPAGVEVYGVAIVPPDWLQAADVPPLEVAIAEYLDDARTALGGWRPSAGSAQAFGLTVVFHDVRGSNYWDATTRTAWLGWPRGASGKPVAVAFAPLLHHVLVLDRRRERGTASSAPWTAAERACATRGLNLAVRLNTRSPQDFEP